MRIAAEAGVAPPLHYVDEQAGVAIMEFIATKPLASYPGGPVELVHALGGLTAKLQASPQFPVFVDYRTVIRRLTERLQTRFAPGLLDRHREALERICETLPWDAATHVASHNDPNPRNILFDGQRLWLVDWETAYRNDPFVDVAILADNLAQTPELEDALLAAWLGREVDAEDRQRVKVVRALTRLYYAGLLAAFVVPSTPVMTDLDAPGREEFRRGIANGTLQFAAAETRALLVKMLLAGFLELL
jgi:Ser/Thr protein kinase RdoA (MazF antagonist)